MHTDLAVASSAPIFDVVKWYSVCGLSTLFFPSTVSKTSNLTFHSFCIHVYVQTVIVFSVSFPGLEFVLAAPLCTFPCSVPSETILYSHNLDCLPQGRVICLLLFTNCHTQIFCGITDHCYGKDPVDCWVDLTQSGQMATVLGFCLYVIIYCI